MDKIQSYVNDRISNSPQFSAMYQEEAKRLEVAVTVKNEKV